MHWARERNGKKPNQNNIKNAQQLDMYLTKRESKQTQKKNRAAVLFETITTQYCEWPCQWQFLKSFQFCA